MAKLEIFMTLQRQQGIESDEEEEEEAPTAKAQSQGAPGDLPPSDSDSEEDSDEDDVTDLSYALLFSSLNLVTQIYIVSTTAQKYTIIVINV